MNKYDYDKIFDFIVDYKKKNDGNSPTVRTITEQFGISSTSVTYYVLRKLVKWGKITLNKGTAQLINVVGGRWSYRE